MTRAPSIARPDLWSLPEALGHLDLFVSAAAGLAGKSAELVVEAPAVLVSGALIEVVVPALLPLFEKALAEGIDHPVGRIVAGRPLTGRILLSVTLRTDRIVFSVGHDGRAAVAKAAVDPRLARARRRVAELGGKVLVEAGEGGRTVLSLSIPRLRSFDDTETVGRQGSFA